jgi:hypothetical protein
MNPDPFEPNRERLEEVIAEFQRMPVPDAPPSQELLARLAAQSQEAIPPAPATSRPKRRFYMRPAFQFATAASILAVAIGWVLFGGSATTALADVIKEAEKHTLVKYKQLQITDDTAQNLTGTLESVVYADLKAPRTRLESKIITLNGTVESVSLQVSDAKKGVLLAVLTETVIATGDVTQKGATLVKIGQTEEKPFGGIAQNTTFLGYLRELQKHKDTTSEKETLDGRTVTKYRLADGNRTLTVWVDPKTKLPIRQEYEMIDPTPNISRNKFVFTDFEWDPKVDDMVKLFSTEPPEGYVIDDQTKKDK